MSGGSRRLAVDIGGTFVDAVELDTSTGAVRLAKAPTTPARPWEGVEAAIDALGTPLSEVEVFVHGTTLGLNAVLERRGARTGIITNAGLRDVFLIGRANVPDEHMYDFQYERPPSLVRRRDTVGVAGRITATGEILEALDEEAVLAAAEQLVASGVQSIAICFLHSYRDPAHERRAAELIRTAHPDVHVSVSTDITREYREYERTSTAVVDAYIRPVFGRYVERLEQVATARGLRGRFLIMRSGGGAMTAEQAKRSPTHTILSGPAGGIVGAAHLARALRLRELLTFDVGGTSLDTCLIEDGTPVSIHEAELERYPLLIPVYDIRTLGAGGGSIASVDGGLLKVGPESAGAEPGPIAYGRGGARPTVTDAALCLGYLDAERFLGGRMRLRVDAARRGIEELLAAPLGQSVDEAAAGVVSVLIARTVGAVRQITVERARDPQSFSLLAFGGAGPLVAPLLAREMGIREVVVPAAPAAFSAWGMLAADVTDDFARTDLRVLGDAVAEDLEAVFLELEEEATRSLCAQGIEAHELLLERQLDLRYLGQEHALTLTVGQNLDEPRLRGEFEEQHRARYGHAMDNRVQILTVRVRACARSRELELPPLALRTGKPDERALVGRRTAWCFARGEPALFRVYDRGRLGRSDRIDGPAIVDEGTSTTVIHSDQQLSVDGHGHLVIRRKEDA
jgi:N-methylhydantoinase A